MTEINKLTNAIVGLTAHMREEFELHVRVRFIGSDEHDVCVSLFNNYKHECCYIAHFLPGVDNIEDFCINLDEAMIDAGALVDGNDSKDDDNDEEY